MAATKEVIRHGNQSGSLVRDLRAGYGAGEAVFEAVFGLTLNRLESPIPGMDLWSFPMQQDVLGATGALVRMEGKDSGGGGTLIYFSCADCSVEAAKAAANGGQLFREKFPIGQYGFIALVYDTEGNMIGLHSMQ